MLFFIIFDCGKFLAKLVFARITFGVDEFLCKTQLLRDFEWINFRRNIECAKIDNAKIICAKTKLSEN